MLELILSQHMQNISLIFVLVYGTQQPITTFCSLHSDVMSRRHEICAKSERMIQQKCPADLTVANQARIWSLAACITVEEVLHNRVMKNIFGIDDIKRNIKLRCHAACLPHRIGST